VCALVASMVSREATPNSPKMTKRSTKTSLMFVCGSLLAGSWNLQSAQAQSFKVDWTNERLTVTASNASLAEVLAEVGRQTGAKVLGLDKVADSITTDIREATLADALRTLLTDATYIIAGPYRKTGDGDSRVVVWLLGRALNGLSAHPCPATTGTGSARGAACEEVTRDAGSSGWLVAGDALAGQNPEVPRGQAEAQRLQTGGFFDLGRGSGALLTLAKSEHPSVRLKALETLAVQNLPGASEALDAALEDSNPEVRSEALGLLLSLGGSDSVQWLGSLLRHRDPAVRAAAVITLGGKKEPEAEFQLKRALSDDNDAVRSAASQALAQRANKE